ncbi:Histidine kinase [Cryptosporangium aurantiacum]|uniref:histidine kinase n=1 Tax=Cryptosporangium aurantiacum TaxID=134849 RepID=A0A1M7RLZ9_9ACTN|nr:Histidine kinase [Cryptosporangium aurantiacum]
MVGTSFVAGGAVSWWLRPRVRVGPLLVAVGALWLAAKVPPEDALPAGLEAVRVSAWAAVLAHLVVAFPTGRLVTPAQRLVVGLTYLSVATLAGLELVGPRSEGLTAGATIVVVDLCGAAILALRLTAWRQSPATRRRHLTPMVAVVSVAVLAVIVLKPARIAGYDASGLLTLLPLALAAVPLGYLGSLLRHRLDRGRVADLVVKLHDTRTPTSIEEALRRALHDPELRVGYRMAGTERYVDVDGRDLPISDDPDRVTTRVDRGRHPLAILVHDRSLLDEPALIRAATAAVGLALDNERLTADLRARVTQIAEARDDVLSAAEAERRRIERDLHDGVQQRLLSVLMTLGLAGSVLRRSPERVGPLLAEARSGTQAVLDDLRALVQGIHPPMLTERGLAAAVKELVALSPTPVDARIEVPPGPLPAEAESTAYYVVAEGLTNVARHAEADQVHLVVGVAEGRLRVEISDDGRGGADPSAGTGLDGLRSRVERGGGTVSIDSPPNAGTRLVAVLPCAS